MSSEEYEAAKRLIDIPDVKIGNYHGDNARCIDLLIKENQESKK